MNKKKLYDLLLQESRYSASEYVDFVKKYLDEFFEANVVVTKGENRHIRADMIHQWAEGAKIGVFDSGFLYEIKNPNFDTTDKLEIVPPEPEYEYLFYNSVGNTKWLTLKEWNNNTEFIQARETKRERKQCS